MVADGPLEAQMQRIAHECQEGERNESYETILPLRGQFHQAMAFQDVVKFCLWDSCLDSLAAASGLSSNMIENFRVKKDYHTNLRLLRQALVALWIRLIDVLFESASILLENSISRDLNMGYLASCQSGSGKGSRHICV